jgi:sugar-specific transcriptional regulator TrmB
MSIIIVSDFSYSLHCKTKVLYLTVMKNMTNKNEQSLESEQKALVDRLIAFGFSSREALVYIYLLKKGTETGGSKIATGTDLHRQYVYTALLKLIEEGLVEEVPHGKQSKYKAMPPIEIEKIGRRRSIIASDLARDLNVISSIGNNQDFEVIQGVRAIQQYEMNYIEQANSTWEEYIIGGASEKFSLLMGDYLGEYLAEKNKKNMTVRYLGSTNEVDLYKKYLGLYKNQEYRFIDDLPSGVSHMVIRNDSVSFYSFLTPPLMYVVKSPVIAENYKQFFMMLWGMASK